MLSPGTGQVTHALLTRPPLKDFIRPKTSKAFPFDLHVLGTPPAFILSQDRTLKFKFDPIQKPLWLLNRFTVLRFVPENFSRTFKGFRPQGSTLSPCVLRIFRVLCSVQFSMFPPLIEGFCLTALSGDMVYHITAPNKSQANFLGFLNNFSDHKMWPEIAFSHYILF